MGILDVLRGEFKGEGLRFLTKEEIDQRRKGAEAADEAFQSGVADSVKSQGNALLYEGSNATGGIIPRSARFARSDKSREAEKAAPDAYSWGRGTGDVAPAAAGVAATGGLSLPASIAVGAGRAAIGAGAGAALTPAFNAGETMLDREIEESEQRDWTGAGTNALLGGTLGAFIGGKGKTGKAGKAKAAAAEGAESAEASVFERAKKANLADDEIAGLSEQEAAKAIAEKQKQYDDWLNYGVSQEAFSRMNSADKAGLIDAQARKMATPYDEPIIKRGADGQIIYELKNPIEALRQEYADQRQAAFNEGFEKGSGGLKIDELPAWAKEGLTVEQLGQARAKFINQQTQHLAKVNQQWQIAEKRGDSRGIAAAKRAYDNLQEQIAHTHDAPPVGQIHAGFEYAKKAAAEASEGLEPFLQDYIEGRRSGLTDDIIMRNASLNAELPAQRYAHQFAAGAIQLSKEGKLSRQDLGKFVSEAYRGAGIADETTGTTRIRPAAAQARQGQRLLDFIEGKLKPDPLGLPAEMRYAVDEVVKTGRVPDDADIAPKYKEAFQKKLQELGSAATPEEKRGALLSVAGMAGTDVALFFAHPLAAAVSFVKNLPDYEKGLQKAFSKPKGALTEADVLAAIAEEFPQVREYLAQQKGNSPINNAMGAVVDTVKGGAEKAAENAKPQATQALRRALGADATGGGQQTETPQAGQQPQGGSELAELRQEIAELKQMLRGGGQPQQPSQGGGGYGLSGLMSGIGTTLLSASHPEIGARAAALRAAGVPMAQANAMAADPNAMQNLGATPYGAQAAVRNAAITEGTGADPHWETKAQQGEARFGENTQLLQTVHSLDDQLKELDTLGSPGIAGKTWGWGRRVITGQPSDWQRANAIYNEAMAKLSNAERYAAGTMAMAGAWDGTVPGLRIWLQRAKSALENSVARNEEAGRQGGSYRLRNGAR